MKIIEKNLRAIEHAEFGKFLIDVLIKSKTKHNNNNYRKGFNDEFYEEKYVLSQINFKRHMNLIIFGIGSLHLIQKILKKISKDSTITIVENDIVFLKKIFNIQDLEWLFSDKRVSVISGSIDDVVRTLEYKISTIPFLINVRNIQWVTSPYAKTQYQEDIDKIKHYVMNQTKYYISNLGNDINDILAGMKYTVENNTTMKEGLFLNSFKNSYKNKPAIIVAGGPSLDKNIGQLKNAYGKALILSVDTTYKKIMDLGIRPDSVSSIERYEVVYDAFFSDENVPEDSVFIGPPVVVKKIFDLFDRKIVSGRTGELYVNDIMKEVGADNIDIGISCTHVAYAFAKHVGANPIIFIGQDLAFSKDGKTHTKDASEITVKSSMSARKTTVLGNDGDIYKTTFIYKQFLAWYENDILKFPQTLFINATEGGARIKGTTLMPLRQVIEQYCQNEIKPLYQVYDEFLESQVSELKIKKGFVNYIGDLIASVENSLLIVNKLQNEMSTISDDYNTENLAKLMDIKRELTKIYLGNEKLLFIIQSIYFLHHRRLSEFPVELNGKEYLEIKYVLLRFCNQLNEVFESLLINFEKFKEEI